MSITTLDSCRSRPLMVRVCVTLLKYMRNATESNQCHIYLQMKVLRTNKCAFCKQIQRIENEVLQEKGILRTKINNTIVLTWLLLWESSSAAAATAVAGEKSLRNTQWGMQETHLVHQSLRASAKLYSSVFAGLLKEESSQTRTLKGKRTTVKNMWATRKSVAWKAQTDAIHVCQPRNRGTEFSIRGVAPHKYADKSTTKPF